MSGANIEVVASIELTLKSLIDASIITIWVSSSPRLHDIPTTFYYPILKSIGDLGVSLGNFLPTSSTSSIELDNSHGSLGYERRFVDLLERYTLINQTISVYLAFGASGETESVAPTLEWVGICKNVSVRDDRLVINIAGRPINDRVMTCAIDSAEGSFETAPIRSLGQHIPLVFGSGVLVKPIIVKDEDTDFIDYAYQTTLGTKFMGGGITEYYCKPQDSSDYGRVYGAASVSTKLFDALTGTLITVATGNDESHRTRDITVPNQNYCLTHAEVVFLQGTAGATGSFSLEIWSKDRNGYPWKQAGQSIREKSDFTWGAGNVTVYFVFPTPIPLVNDFGYVAYITQSSSSGSDIQPAYISGSSTYASYTRAKIATVDTSQAWVKHTFNQRNFASAFYGLTFSTSNPSASDVTTNGLSYQKLLVYQNSGGGWAGLIDSDLSGLDLVVKCNGLSDDSSGTLTGTPSQILANPLHAIRALTYEYNGTTWVSGQLSTTYNDSTHAATLGRYARVLGGKTTGRSNRSEIIESLCRNIAARITINASATTPLGVWFWGYRSNTMAYISDDDLIVDSYDITGSETIINTAEIFYADDPRSAELSNGSTQGQFKNYKSRLYLAPESDGNCSEISTLSKTIYGERRAAEVTYNYINDYSTAYSLAEFLLRTYTYPHHYVDISLPYYKYKSLKLMDVVEITAVRLPAFFGTSSSAKLPSYGAAEVSVSQSNHFRRANNYRAMIESRQIALDATTGSARLKLSLRILNNKKDPT